MTTQEMIEVMQAYEDGKKIQVNSGKGWVDLDDGDEPSWNWVISKYRIKPEEKYRPYKNADEMIADFKERFNVKVPSYSMPEIWVKNKTLKTRGHIYEFGLHSVMMFGVGTRWSMDELFNGFTYLDGSPCGMKEE